MTNEELQAILNNPKGISEEDLDKIWADMKALDEQREAEFDALPENERKRYEKEWDDPSLDRFMEDPLGYDDE